MWHPRGMYGMLSRDSDNSNDDSLRGPDVLECECHFVYILPLPVQSSSGWLCATAKVRSLKCTTTIQQVLWVLYTIWPHVELCVSLTFTFKFHTFCFNIFGDDSHALLPLLLWFTEGTTGLWLYWLLICNDVLWQSSITLIMMTWNILDLWLTHIRVQREKLTAQWVVNWCNEHRHVSAFNVNYPKYPFKSKVTSADHLLKDACGSGF